MPTNRYLAIEHHEERIDDNRNVKCNLAGVRIAVV